MATKIVTKNSSTASAVPTASDLVQGELAVNVADKRLFTEDNGGSVVELGTNPSSLTVSGNIDVDGVTNLDAVDIDGAVDMASTLQVDGAATFTTEITANGGIALGDNDKATFGAGDDLQIFHTGSYSAIKDVGTGALFIGGDNYVDIGNGNLSQTRARFYDNTVELRSGGSTKLATTSTGIDVTGTATMDGLVVDGTSVLDSETNFVANSTASNKSLVLASSGATGGNGQYGASVAFSRINSESPRAAIAAVNTDSNYERMGLSFWTHPNNTADVMVKRMQIDHDGDISFYEDTGTTAKFFWDASAERLGIGTSSPSYKTEIVGGNLGVGGGAGASQLGVEIRGIALSAIPSAQVRGYIATGDSTIGVAGDLLIAPRTNVAASVRFITGTTPTERLRIDSTGRVGIGTSSPDKALTISASDSQVRLYDADGTNQFASFQSDNGITKITSRNNTSHGQIAFQTYNGTAVSERMRIDSSGRVGIGTSSPSAKLHVSSSGDTIARITSADGNGAFLDLGDASDPDGGRIVYDSGSNLGFSTASTERMRIDASGNVGIGTVSPSGYRLNVSKGATGNIAQLTDGVANTFIVRSDANTLYAGNANNYPVAFVTNNAERMRIDSSGNLLVGTTDSNVSNNNGSGTGFNFLASGQQKIATDDNLSLILNRLNGDGGIVEFKKDGTAVGSISVSSSATAYNTSSDQRLKDNIVDAPSASDDIDAIQVRSFDWKADGSHQKYGMVAQELNTVAPEAVSGDADSEDMMGVDYSKLVPMLIKEIQSLRNRVAQLEE